MADLSVFKSSRASAGRSQPFNRQTLAEALDASAEQQALAQDSGSRWTEQLCDLRDALINKWEADAAVVQAAIQLFSWLTLQSLQQSGLRRETVLPRAREIMTRPAAHAFRGLLADDEISRLFASWEGASDFTENLGQRLDLFWGAEDFTPAHTHSLMVTTDLLYELAVFGHSLYPRRESVDAGKRTTVTSVGEQLCELCFRPSHRYRLSHGHQPARKGIVDVGHVLFTGRSRRKRRREDHEAIFDASHKFCKERHSTSKELRTRNRGRIATDGRESKRADVSRELNKLDETLQKTGLARPRSRRLSKMVAWYRCRPRIANRELALRFKDLTAKRSRAAAIAGHILSALPGYDSSAAAIHDGTLLLEVWRIGVARAVPYDGADLPIAPPQSASAEFESGFDECIRRAKTLLGIRDQDLTGYDVALLEDLGMEIAIADNLLRFTFESPTWLRLACGLKLRPD